MYENKTLRSLPTKGEGGNTRGITPFRLFEFALKEHISEKGAQP
jgi:hypothetical protein